MLILCRPYLVKEASEWLGRDIRCKCLQCSTPIRSNICFYWLGRFSSVQSAWLQPMVSGDVRQRAGPSHAPRYEGCSIRWCRAFVSRWIYHTDSVDPRWILRYVLCLPMALSSRALPRGMGAPGRAARPKK